MSDDLWKFLIRIHHQNGMIPANRSRVNEYRMSLSLNLIVFFIFLIEKLFSELVSLHKCYYTFSLVISSSSSRLRWNMISLLDILAKLFTLLSKAKKTVLVFLEFLMRLFYFF